MFGVLPLIVLIGVYFELRVLKPVFPERLLFWKVTGCGAFDFLTLETGPGSSLQSQRCALQTSLCSHHSGGQEMWPCSCFFSRFLLANRSFYSGIPSGWRRGELNQTAPAGARLRCTGNSHSPVTGKSGVRWAWPRRTSLSRDSRLHLSSGTRWCSAWRTVSAAGLTGETTPRTRQRTWQPTSTRWNVAGRVPGCRGKEWSSAFGSRRSKTRAPIRRRRKSGLALSENGLHGNGFVETVSVREQRGKV